MSLMYVFQISQALQIPSSDSAKNHDVSPGSLRRTNSSPSVLSGSLDTLSPRDSISDIVQIGPPAKLDKTKIKTEDSPLSGEKPGVTSPIQQVAPETVIKAADNSAPKPLSDNSGQFRPEIEKLHSVPKEYTSLLTKQLTPSTDSSEASSSQDEVGELPINLRRQRGHTIAAIQQTGFAPVSQNQDLGTTRTGKDSKVGISPSFVFLQLYHSGQLQVNEAPHLLPDNEVLNFLLLNCSF